MHMQSMHAFMLLRYPNLESVLSTMGGLLLNTFTVLLCVTLWLLKLYCSKDRIHNQIKQSLKFEFKGGACLYSPPKEFLLCNSKMVFCSGVVMGRALMWLATWDAKNTHLIKHGYLSLTLVWDSLGKGSIYRNDFSSLFVFLSVCLPFSRQVSLYSLDYPGTCSCRPGCPWTHTDHLHLPSQQGINMCATTAQFTNKNHNGFL